MNANLPSPAMRFLRRETHIVMPLLIQKLFRTLRESTPGERGDGINHPSQLNLGLPQLMKGSLQILGSLVLRYSGNPRSWQGARLDRILRSCRGGMHRARFLSVQARLMVWIEPRFLRTHRFSI